MPDFGDPRTGEGERKVPPGAVVKRLREQARRDRARRRRLRDTARQRARERTAAPGAIRHS